MPVIVAGPRFVLFLLASAGRAAADPTEALASRTVFCARGGLFTGLRIFRAATGTDSRAAAPESVRLQVCCTTTPFIEGQGVSGGACAELGDASGTPLSRCCCDIADWLTLPSLLLPQRLAGT